MISRSSLVGGALVVACAAIIVWGFLGKPTPFAEQTSVWATFRNPVSFSRFDRQVRVAGANVGTVGAIRRVGDHALVQLLLDPSEVGPIHADATAEIRPHTLFDGTAFVELWPGSRGAPLLGSRPIPLSRTQDYVTVDEALRVAAPPTRLALQATLRDLGTTLGHNQVTELRHSFTSLPRLLPDLQAAASAVAGPDRTELAASIAGLSGTIDALARGDASLGPILQDTEQTVAALRAQNDGPLGRAIGVLPAALLATETGGQSLRTVIDRLEPLANDLRPALHQLTPTLAQLPPVLSSARPVLASATPFIAQLRGALAAVPSAASPARRLLSALQPTLQLVRNPILPTVLAPSKFGIPNYEQLLAAAVPAGAGTLSGTVAPAQATIAAGHYWSIVARGLIGFNGLPPCSTYPGSQLQGILLNLQLCQP